ncbi:MAG TPA: DUF2231 domain-containing protein [Actinomycetota bacterium]|nr:DUF2231 domain-containing protein [Actinomycetota bacterium]
MSLLRYRSPTGEVRPWRFVEIVQGKPLGHPSHTMFVHFPVALYLAVIVFDVMTRIHPDPALVRAGTYLMIGGIAGTGLAAITGLVDWWGMVRGSSKRRLATRHLLFQLTAAAFFAADFALRWGKRDVAQAEITWIVLEAIGYAILSVGQWIGGILVYEKGMRVSTGGARADAA